MMLMHGFSSNLLGRRTRSFGSGGRRVGATTVEPPRGGMADAYRNRVVRR